MRSFHEKRPLRLGCLAVNCHPDEVSLPWTMSLGNLESHPMWGSDCSPYPFFLLLLFNACSHFSLLYQVGVLRRRPWDEDLLCRWQIKDTFLGPQERGVWEAGEEARHRCSFKQCPWKEASTSSCRGPGSINPPAERPAKVSEGAVTCTPMYLK